MRVPTLLPAVTSADGAEDFNADDVRPCHARMCNVITLHYEAERTHPMKDTRFSERFTVKLPAALRERLDAVALAHATTASEFARQAMRERLERLEPVTLAPCGTGAR